MQISLTVVRKCITLSSHHESINKLFAMFVIKRDGQHEKVHFDKITSRIRRLCYNLNHVVDPCTVSQKVVAGVYKGITTSELDELAAETAAFMTSIHPDFGVLAARISVSNLHKSTLKSFSDTATILFDYVDSKTGLSAPMLAADVYAVIQSNAAELNAAIVYDRDFGYDYFGFKTLQRSYLMRANGKIVERPQHMLMRVAVGIHAGDIESVLQTYNMMSLKWFTHATPTLFNAGTCKPQLSSCFLLTMFADSVDGIYDTLKATAMISKEAGGIGLSVHNIRATGSYIRGTNGASNGLVPMLRVFNNTARYVDQGGGKRKGAFAIYLEPWHADIFAFLDLKKNHGIEEERARDLFYGMWINDLFMERVEADGDWSLFCIAAGSAVAMSDGTSKLIENVVKDDQVLARDMSTDQAHGLAPRRVTHTSESFKSCVELRFDDGRTLICTPDHRILTSDNIWVRADHLEINVSRVAVGIQYPVVSRDDADGSVWSLDTMSEIGTLNMNERRHKSLAFARLLGYVHFENRSEVHFAHKIDLDTMIRDLVLLTGESPAVKRLLTGSYSLVIPSQLRAASRALFDSAMKPGFPQFILSIACPISIVREFFAGFLGANCEPPHLACVKRMPFTNLAFDVFRWQPVVGEDVSRFDAQVRSISDRLGLVGGLVRNYSVGNKYTTTMGRRNTIRIANTVGFRYAHHKQMRMTAIVALYGARELIQRQYSLLSEIVQKNIAKGHSAKRAVREANYAISKLDILDSSVAAWEPWRCVRSETTCPRFRMKRALSRFNVTKLFAHEYRAAPNFIENDEDASVIPLFRVKLIGRVDVGMRRVYDLTVPSERGDEFASFTANGIVVHNCPNEAPGLSDTHSEQFNEMYIAYENTPGKARRVIKARELWNTILDAQTETGTPYMMFKDACNSKSNQQNLGTIHCSNLCTEIVEFTSPEEIAVCMVGETMVQTRFGPRRITECDGMDVLVPFESDEVFKRQERLVTARLINRGIKSTLTIQSKGGKDIIVTSTHAMLVIKSANVYEWKLASEIVVGDRMALSMNDALPGFVNVIGSQYDIEYSTAGWISGDGSVGVSSGIPTVHVCFNQGEELAQILVLNQLEAWNASMVLVTVQPLQGAPKSMREMNYATWETRNPGFLSLLSDRFGFTTSGDSNTIHDKIYSATCAQQSSFLMGLFCADGCVKASDTEPSVELWSSNVYKLAQVQELLGSFGIHGRIVHGELPETKASHGTIKIFGSINVKRFACYIGFHLCPRKQEMLNKCISSQQVHDGSSNSALVTSIVHSGDQPTYDLALPSGHHFVANGKIVHNCNLASIALPMFISKQRVFDFNKLYDVTYAITKNLNKVIDVNHYPVPQAEYSNLKNRPIGIGCFPVHDTRVLTDAGFLFVDEIEALLSSGKVVLYAAYDVKMQQIIYTTGRVVYPENTAGTLIDFTQREEDDRCSLDSSRISLRVTPNHDMFVQIGDIDQAQKVRWPNIDGYEQPPTSTMPCSDGSTSGGCKHTAKQLHDMQKNVMFRFIALAGNGVHTSDGDFLKMKLSNRLGLDSSAKIDAFLKLYGFWLGSGSVWQQVASNYSLVLPRRSASEIAHLKVLLDIMAIDCLEQSNADDSSTLYVTSELLFALCNDEYGLEASASLNSRESSFTSEESVQPLMPWILKQCNKNECRLIIDGLSRASGTYAQHHGTVWTSGAAFRDELVVLMYHGGYSAYYVPSEIATVGGWRVHFMDLASYQGHKTSWPVLESASITTVVYTGNIWCVNVDHSDHLIIAQRACRGEDTMVKAVSLPVIVGNCQGLADAFILMRFPFESDEARRLNKDIFETMYFAALQCSADLAKVHGHYASYPGSPASKGVLQFDMWNEPGSVIGSAKGVPDAYHSGRWNWKQLRSDIALSGLRNSLLLAPMPTASTSQILGNNECFEPYTSNIYVRRTLAGEFVCVCRHLLTDLIALGLWTPEMKNKMIALNGSIQQIDGIPAHIKKLYKTVWEISQKTIIDMAAERGVYIDQSQSLNIHMTNVSRGKLTSMHFHAWKSGLKTGMYYLRTKPSVDAIKFTIEPEILQSTKLATTIAPEQTPDQMRILRAKKEADVAQWEAEQDQGSCKGGMCSA